MLRNLASSLFLTERETDPEFDENIPKVKGRIVTTLHKAKEVRPLVERCITIARRSLESEDEAQQYATTAERGTEEWKQWRSSEEWQKWNNAMAPAITARRRVIQLIGDKEATSVLFDEIAPRFEDRDGGYTRILRLARPRLGDAGVQAILEFVGVHDREKVVSEKPSFSDVEDVEDEEAVAPVTEDESTAEDEAPDDAEEPKAEASTEESADETDEKEEKSE